MFFVSELRAFSRSFDVKKMLVIMQVDYTGSSESIAKTGVSLKQGVDQFSCTENGPTANSLNFKERKMYDSFSN